jgi:hypothetical protein
VSNGTKAAARPLTAAHLQLIDVLVGRLVDEFEAECAEQARQQAAEAPALPDLDRAA